MSVIGTITRTAGAHTFTINNAGDLQGGSTANIASLVINTGGNADITGQLTTAGTTIDGGTLTAGSHGTTSSEAFIIRNGGSVTISGAMVMGSNGSIQYGDKSGGSVDNTLDVGSLDLSFISSVIFQESGASAASLALSVAGDLNVESNEDAMVGWDTTGVVLTLDASGSQDLEAFSTDFDDGSNGGVWFGDGGCVRPWASLTVKNGATVTVVDNHDNAFRNGYSLDAIYVDGDVTIESGATLNLGSFVLYYTGTLTNNGTINGTTRQMTKRCYGDFDNDGDVDLSDFATFSTAFMGPGTETNDAVVDRDCDKDVDLTDFSLFSQNFGGPGTPCTPGGESAGGAGESAEGIADWCLSHLSEEACESFAEKLAAVAEEMGETQVAAFYLDIAELLTAE